MCTLYMTRSLAHDDFTDWKYRQKTYTHVLTHAEKEKEWCHMKSMKHFFSSLAKIIFVCINVGPSINKFTIMMYRIVFLLRFVISFATIIAFEYNLKFKRYNFFFFVFRLTDFILFYFSIFFFFGWNFFLETFRKYIW